MNRPSGFLILAALMSPTTLMAFAPTPDLSFDEAVGPPSRVHHTRPATQERLTRQSLAWQTFTAEHPSWQVRWDEATSTPLRMLGAGIDLGAMNHPDDAVRVSLDFLHGIRDLMGVNVAELQLLAHEVRGDQRFVFFQRTVAGVPVEGALVQLRFKFGKLVMIGLESHPEAATVSTRPQISAQDALAAALEMAGEGATVVDPGRRVILPIEGPEGLSYALTWANQIHVDGPMPAQWTTFIDATTGVPLHRYNDVRYTHRGTITAGHEARTVGDEIINAPLFDVNVEASRMRQDTTDRNGGFTIPGRGDSSLTTELNGTYVWVRNSSGANPAASFDATDGGGNDFDWGYGDVAPMAATHTYHFTHVVRDRALLITPDLPELQGKMIANVEQNSTCNAYYNGWSINFFKAGGGCNNTGRIADVVFHEYGHHYHHSLVVTGRTDGSIGEGSGDYLSATITGDPNIAPGFMEDGSGIRNIGPNRVYPDDLAGEVHSDGLIWGGAMWDLRTRLITEMGPIEGVRTADNLFATALMGGPTLATAYEEVLIADDDDGDLSNGTPHQCLIAEEMGHHGMGPGVRASFLHSDTPTASAGQALTVSAEITTSFETCLSLDTNSATLRWSTEPNGPFQDVPMTFDGEKIFTAAIPPQPAGSLVYYTFGITDSDGELHEANRGRSFALYQTWFGELTEIACDDFEDSDGGYTHQLIAGEISEGADDWMWGSPRGAAGDPPAAASGKNVWGNDLAPDGFNGEYQANKINALSSPFYSTNGFNNVILRYRRWLNVEDGQKDLATIYVDKTPVWFNDATASQRSHTEDNRWTWHYVDLGGIADDRSDVVLTWELSTDDSVQMGGWTIDDVCLLSVQ